MQSDERNKKVYDFIKGNVANFIIILTSVAYIFYGMVALEKTSLTIWQCIAKAGMGIIAGFMIKQGMGENGFNKGYRSHLWIDNKEKYNAVCNTANPYLERVDNFYFCEEIEKRKTYRRANLMAARMRYDWFFDKDGNYIDNKERYEKLDKKQRKVLEKCVSVKIYNLNLFGEYNNEISADTKREKTDKDQRTKMFTRNGSVQIITAIIGVYFVAQFDGWNWGEFITSSIQVCIWLCCGITQLFMNYNYIVVDKVAKLVRKKELIAKFTRGCEAGLYLTNPYDVIENVATASNTDVAQSTDIVAVPDVATNMEVNTNEEVATSSVLAV